jgi:hypothetical protein
MQVVEIGKIGVPDLTDQKEVCEIPSQWKKTGHSGVCLSSHQRQEMKIGRSQYHSSEQPVQKMIPYF